MVALRRFLGLVAIAAVSACASRGAVDDPAAIAQLGFLNGPDVTRAYVEARLGAPSTTYEGGAVASYTLFMKNDRLATTVDGNPGMISGRYALLLHYDADGRLVRRALTRLD
jgi:hypothetical protein